MTDEQILQVMERVQTEALAEVTQYEEFVVHILAQFDERGGNLRELMCVLCWLLANIEHAVAGALPEIAATYAIHSGIIERIRATRELPVYTPDANDDPHNFVLVQPISVVPQTGPGKKVVLQ